MSKKNAQKSAARDMQALTGRSYQDCLNAVRQWEAEGKKPREEVEKIAASLNDAEDRSGGQAPG